MKSNLDDKALIYANVLNNDWSGHGTGYRMIRESNILSYLKKSSIHFIIKLYISLSVFWV